MNNNIKLLNKNKALNQATYDKYANKCLVAYTCPNCSSKNCIRYGSYSRHIYFNRSEDGATTINIIRMKCNSCRKTKQLLHPLMIPYKRYCMPFFLAVLAHTQSYSKRSARKLHCLSRGYFHYIWKQFITWHQFALQTLAVAFPPPDANTFSYSYQAAYSYQFMQIISYKVQRNFYFFDTNRL